MQEIRQYFTVTYSIDELKRLIDRPIIYRPVNFFRYMPIHLVVDESIPGEIFKEGDVFIDRNHPEKAVKIWASNFGRVKINNEICHQKCGRDSHFDYLEIEKHPYEYLPNVHRIIAFVWCERPQNENPHNLKVHHINNNGFDNRPCNLLWVTQDEHSKIEEDLLMCRKYNYINYSYI